MYKTDFSCKSTSVQCVTNQNLVYISCDVYKQNFGGMKLFRKSYSYDEFIQQNVDFMTK